MSSDGHMKIMVILNVKSTSKKPFSNTTS